MSASTWQQSYSNSAPLATREYQILPMNDTVTARKFEEFDWKTLSSTLTLTAKDCNKLLLINDTTAAADAARTITLPNANTCVGKYLELQWATGAITITTGVTSIVVTSPVIGSIIGTTSAATTVVGTAIALSGNMTLTGGPDVGSYLKFTSVGSAWVVKGQIVGSTTLAFA